MVLPRCASSHPWWGGDLAGSVPRIRLSLRCDPFRLLCGLVIGMTLGLLTGLALPYWPAVRRTAWEPMNFLRMIPLLVAAPFLQVVAVNTFSDITMYIAFGVWTVLVVATMNAEPTWLTCTSKGLYPGCLPAAHLLQSDSSGVDTRIALRLAALHGRGLVTGDRRRVTGLWVTP